jgi:hypothetical protein
MVDKNQPVVDNVHCPTYPGPDTWITYPPGWWIEIFGYPPPHRSVENLSTTCVERILRSGNIRGNTGTFTHLPGVVHIFDRFIHFFDTFHDSNSRTSLTIVSPCMWKVWKVWKTYPPKMWINGYSHACCVYMWKTYPPRLWINTCLTAIYVESVENLSTENVDKWLLIRLLCVYVENLSTAIVENLSRWITSNHVKR